MLVAGTSQATLLAVIVARTARAGAAVRAEGVSQIAGERGFSAYASSASHICAAKALDVAGFGTSSLRLVSTGTDGRMDLVELRETITKDRAAGRVPFLVVATAGSTDTGAIDDLSGIAAVAAEEGLWMHVDGAFGALLSLSAELRPLLAGIEKADSIAFDFHKWMHVPYDAGCLLVRDGAAHKAAFTTMPSFCRHFESGLAAPTMEWPVHYGVDLTRGFRALKIWFTMREFGTVRLGDAILQSVRSAAAAVAIIDSAPDLERLAPAPLHIICFRFSPKAASGSSELTEEKLDSLNRYVVELHSGAPLYKRPRRCRALLVDVQLSGVGAPSSTTVEGRFAIRMCISNHRTTIADIERLLLWIRARGAELMTRTLGAATVEA